MAYPDAAFFHFVNLSNAKNRVPGISANFGSVSPPANRMEVKASETQGQCREALSEGSV